MRPGTRLPADEDTAERGTAVVAAARGLSGVSRRRLLALSQWGDKWAVDAPFLTRRHSCGQPVTRDTIHAEPAGAPDSAVL
jgi:hypothetical protein